MGSAGKPADLQHAVEDINRVEARIAGHKISRFPNPSVKPPMLKSSRVKAKLCIGRDAASKIARDNNHAFEDELREKFEVELTLLSAKDQLSLGPDEAVLVRS